MGIDYLYFSVRFELVVFLRYWEKLFVICSVQYSLMLNANPLKKVDITFSTSTFSLLISFFTGRIRFFFTDS